MLVGRDRELGEIGATLARLSTGGALYLFAGEPGIGKTRLAAEVAAVARERGVRVSWGRAWEAGGAPPFWPWREALTASGIEFPAAIETGDPAEARFALFREVAGALARSAADAPLLIVLEDLHAADPATLLLLELVANQVRALPLVVVGTYRDLEARLRPEVGDVLARLGRAGRVLQLSPLSQAQVGALLAEAIEGAGDELAAKVFEITRGHPLFVDEVVRDVKLRGVEHGIAIPLGVREIIRQRLERTPAAVRRALEAASVLGVEVAVTVLARMHPDLETLLDDAGRSGLVNVRDGRLRFSHALYREALYHELPRPLRQTLHRRAARVLAESDAPLAEIAHHLLESGAEAAAEAIDHAVRAAEQAVEIFAFEEAALLLARAAAAIPSGPEERALRGRVLVAQGEAKLRSGDASGRELCAQAAGIARSLGDATLLALAGLAYGSVLLMGGVDPVLVEILEAALAGLPASDAPLRARVMARLGAARQPSPPAERQRDITLALDAVAMARRCADRRELLRVLHAASGVLYGAVDPAVRLPIMREQERLAEELGDATRLLHARVRLAIDCLELGDFASYAEVAASLEALASRIGPAAEPWRVPLMRSMLALHDDRFDESLRWQNEARQAAGQGPRARRAQAFHRIGFLRLAERHAELRASVAEVRSLWLAMPYGGVLAEPRVASLLAHVGAADDVKELLERMPEAAFREEISVVHLAEAVWCAGDAAHAEVLYPLVVPYQARWGMYWFDCEIAEASGTRLLAYLAALLGAWDECDRLFERALREIDAAGSRSMAARVRFDMGDLLVRCAHEAERGRTLLGDARVRAENVGLPELVALIDRRHPTLAQPGGRAHASAAPARDFAITSEGEYFAVASARGTLRFKASRGMQYLARLVERPDVAFHVLELAGSTEADRGDAGEVLDARAFQAYRARLDTLRDAAEDAEARGNVEAAETARDEMESIARELARASGRGGRSRRGISAVDRARSAVQRRLKDAIDRIADQDADLGANLRRAVQTGNYCTFRPRA